ncbi:MAG TPA: PH domain-containing protein [Patescibacteria group bacterium]|nr:PH domain-containing protein [Patescibacteria group bacterium]
MNTGIIFDLYEDEEIKYVLRRHWLAFAPNILIVSGMLILFFIGLVVASAFLNSADTTNSVNISQNIGRGILIIFSSIYLLSTVAYFYIAWLDYYMDIFILTNKRIIRLEQMVIFGQKVSETSFQHIQDVSSKVQGLLQTFFSVGTVFVETAGERENFSFTNMKDPGEIAAWILEAQHNIWNKEPEDDMVKLKSDLTIDRKNHNLKKVSSRTTVKQDGIEEAIKDKLLIPKRIIEKLLKKDLQTIDEIPVIVPPNIVCHADPLLIKKGLAQESYRDGRKVIPEGVIWESEQNITPEVLDALNSFCDCETEINE